jgi:L-lactate dehydrogenase (cytochrome)
MLKSLRSVLRFRPVELSPARRRLRRAASVADLRLMARRRLPHGVFDYIDGAAEDELTMGRNAAAFQQVEFRPRVLRDVSEVDPSGTLLGRPLAMPLVLGPTGFTRAAASGGELEVARAAARAGVVCSLSTLGTRSIEEMAAAATGRQWFQVYVWRDRGLVKEMLARAAAAGYEAILPTVDTAVLGRRERDVRRGFTLPPQLGLGTLLDGVLHPAWTWDFITSEPISFANLRSPGAPGGTSAVSLSSFMSDQVDASLSWRDVDWLREQWSGPIVLKGIQSVADASQAADLGIEAIVLSNHGGRQLDGAPPPLELVAPVAEAVAGRTEIICDGGVRRGSDLVKAVALGATACMMARPYLYGLAVAGERGVEHVLTMFDTGVRRTLALAGCRSFAEVGPDLVRWR